LSRKTHKIATTPELDALLGAVRAYAGRMRELRGTDDLSDYIAAGGGADEETLTEPILREILEQVLGFPKDGYFEQLSKSGRKPDFTPVDIIAHSFVLDAKGTNENLDAHYEQIRDYVEERSLTYGILFNLREMRVYRAGDNQHLDEVSFSVEALWEYAEGKRLYVEDIDRLAKFADAFRHKEMSTAQRIEFIRDQKAWAERIAQGDPVRVDVEFLVDRLHKLARTLTDDAAGQVSKLEDFVRFSPGREEKVIGELRTLAIDLAPKTDPATLPSVIGEWATAPGSTIIGRAWRQFFARAAYLAIVRILLYRMWEDVEFVDGALYDGGFSSVYDHMNEDLQRVLKEAFRQGEERYRWLFGSGNNYDWYRPSNDVLVDVLYSLAAVPLGTLDADVLGNLYEAYVDEVDRDRLGQFFTPRSVVRFMMDRVGYSGADAIFDIQGDRRTPKRVFDFSTGSGGFLVEAARRIIDDSGIDLDRDADRTEALQALVRGLTGGEISPFPYYLTEVNLLIQVSRVLGRMALDKQEPPPFTLGVLHMDSLATRKAGTQSFEQIEGELRGDRGILVSNDSYDLVPFDEEKRAHFREVVENETFDYVVGNPPYVAEANNKVLFDRLRALDAWDGTYKGKTDYLYYFLILAAEKLKPGGRLSVIVPAGWCNAGSADFLRRQLGDTLTIEEMYLFGSKRMFEREDGDIKRGSSPLIETLILVARKGAPPKRHRVRIAVLENELELARHMYPSTERTEIDREDLLTYMRRRITGTSPRYGRRDGVLSHDRAQSDFRPEQPWPIKHNREDVGPRVVEHLDRLLKDRSSHVETLETSWTVTRGVETGADAFTERITKRLSPAERASLEAAGCRIGDPIMELPRGTEIEEPWKSHPEFLGRTPEATGILYGAIDDNWTNLVVIDRDTPVPAAIENELTRWKPLLASRAAFARDPSRRWFETAWPRDPIALAAPKVIALYRTDRGRFSLDEDGSWRPSNKVTFVAGKQPEAPVAYLCGVLNSELLDIWYGVRGKIPRDIWRNYEPAPMRPMPYRRPDDDSRADEVADLVRQVAANRRKLLPWRDVVVDLGRTIKNPWRTGPVVVDARAMVARTDEHDLVSLRIHPDVTFEVPNAKAKASRSEPGRIDLVRARKVLGKVEGPSVVLDFIEEIVADDGIEHPEQILVPRDITVFRDACTDAEQTVTKLLVEGRDLVERVERLVCALYEVPDELIELVIAHSDARAATAGRDSE
jgi:hypothetical protein